MNDLVEIRMPYPHSPFLNGFNTRVLANLKGDDNDNQVSLLILCWWDWYIVAAISDSKSDRKNIKVVVFLSKNNFVQS